MFEKIKYRPVFGCSCALCRQARQARRMPLWQESLIVAGILLVSWAAVRWL